MFSRRPSRFSSGLGGLTGGPPAPRDLLVLLGVIFFTFTLQFFATTAPLLALLRLTPAVWQQGFVWQLATYAFIGYGAPSLWFLLTLLILFWFGRDLYYRLGRKAFWQLLAWGVGAGSVAAALAQMAAGLLPGWTSAVPFQLIQGQNILVVVLIAAFASLFQDATIYLFFVLPIKAKWFLPLEILFGFIGFLGTRDLSGFVGLVAAIAMVWSILTPGGARSLTRRFLREPWLRYRRRRYQSRLEDLERGKGWDRRPDKSPRHSGGQPPDPDPDDDPDDSGNGKVRRGPWLH